jgi:ribosomal-protein-alanine N-acetyltransferase
MRKADLTDTETLCALQRLSPGTADWSEEDYRGVLPLEDTSCLLAEGLPRSHAVGFLLARTMPDEMEILNLAVIPTYRGRNVARRLVDEALGWAWVRGARQCWLEVRTSNQPTLSFYRAPGFEEHSCRTNSYRNPAEDAVVCLRRLEAFCEPVLPSRRGAEDKDHPE